MTQDGVCMTVIGMYRRGVWSLGMTVIGMYRRGVWRYDSDRYVQREECGGMTVIGMYRRGVWEYDSDRYVQERSVEV
ncbi:unnamed protein product [Staurois parvus]|uniref:Uncharacterized protein n=1 Tax=Staurois parvus TaxID=386267 RepID=A0ABN9B763_9NEOB|nr:unnamed protein product [Staurois parvus]